MQVAVVEREMLTDALFEGKPVVLNRIEVGRVRRQEFLGAASIFNQGTGFRGLMAAGVIIDHNLSGFKDRYQTVLDIRFKECGCARALEHKRGEEGLLVEGIDQTHPLGAMARLLAPARFPLRAPAVGAGLMIIHAGLIQVYELFGWHRGQLRAKLLPQGFIPLGVTEGLFLCV